MLDCTLACPADRFLLVMQAAIEDTGGGCVAPPNPPSHSCGGHYGYNVSLRTVELGVIGTGVSSLYLTFVFGVNVSVQYDNNNVGPCLPACL